MPQCTAHSKRSHERCQQTAMQGRTVCYMHGGRTPRGQALPQFKHGRYSRYLPAKLAAQYEVSRKDPELLSLRDELSLTDARLTELLQRLHTTEHASRWEALQTAYAGLEASIINVDTAGVSQGMAQVRTLLSEASSDLETWQELFTVIEQRRKLADTEHKRLVSTHQVITIERALLMIGVITEIIARHISDKSVLNNIMIEMQRLTGPSGQQVAEDTPSYG